jgi:putative resolvase
MNAKFITSKQVRAQYGVSNGALRRWAEDGRVNVVKLPHGKRLYNESEINAIFGNQQQKTKKSICYARVSSHKQQSDLERQIQDLRHQFPDHELLSDIGSGLNWNRKNFRALLERVHNGEIDSIVVTNRDRMCRFGLELIEWILEKAGTKLMVLNQNASEDADERATSELSEDLLFIVTVFVAKHHGRRAAANRKRRASQKEEEGEHDEKAAKRRRIDKIQETEGREIAEGSTLPID